jgi:hypothetical protein
VQPPKKPRKAKAGPLAWQVAKFVEAVLSGAKMQDAARAAGYSEKNAPVVASELMRRSDVQERLAKGALDMQARGTLTNADLLGLLEDWATLDFTDCYMEDGKTFKNPKEWPKHIRRAVRELEFGAGGCIAKVKFEPRSKAVELLMKHRGLLADLTVEHVITDARMSKMTDSELLAQVRKDSDAYERHLQARERLRLAAAKTQIAEGGTS